MLERLDRWVELKGGREEEEDALAIQVMNQFLSHTHASSLAVAGCLYNCNSSACVHFVQTHQS